MHGDIDIDSIPVRVQHKERHSLERVWYIASHRPPDAPPGSQLPRRCTQSRNIYNNVLSEGSQVSLSAQSMPLRVSLVGPINVSLKRLKLSTVALRDLNLVRLFCLSLPLPLFLCFSLSLPHPRGHKPATPFALYAIPNSKV